MSASAGAAPAKGSGHSIGFNLGAIALIVAVLGLGLAYGIDAAGRARPADAAPVSRTLGGHELVIPAAWLREDAAHGEGFAKQVELRLILPLGPEAAPRAIEVTLVPRSRVRPSAALLDGVYLHQFMPEQLDGPPGLVGKPLVATDGFAHETVWYDPLSPAPFAAKCMAAVTAGTAGRCLRTVLLAPGIAAVYAFDDDVLVNWREFDARIQRPLAEIGAL